MNILNQDLYINAWNYASFAHRKQTIPGKDISYLNHIGLVTMESMIALNYSTQINNPDLLILCSILHDTIEDTNTTYEDLRKMFSKEIANGVLALSKNKELPSKIEQMKDSILRIKKQPKEVWMVKLSDRITNLQQPPKHWDNNKIINYKNESIMILNELGESNNYLRKRLSNKIENYITYIR